MQVPTRRGDKIPRPKADPFMTAEKYEELKAKLHKWKTINRPREAAEVARLALMGDFSENTGYQVAKGRLRGLNQRILDLEDLLRRAEIITPSGETDQVRLGHSVKIEKTGDKDGAGHFKTYKILGSTESDPLSGIVSHSSPLGAALLGRRVGETIQIESGGKLTGYKIIRID